jgi:hypothetical protein
MLSHITSSEDGESRQRNGVLSNKQLAFIGLVKAKIVFLACNATG